MKFLNLLWKFFKPGLSFIWTSGLDSIDLNCSLHWKQAGFYFLICLTFYPLINSVAFSIHQNRILFGLIVNIGGARVNQSNIHAPLKKAFLLWAAIMKLNWRAQQNMHAFWIYKTSTHHWAENTLYFSIHVLQSQTYHISALKDVKKMHPTKCIPLPHPLGSIPTPFRIDKKCHYTETHTHTKKGFPGPKILVNHSNSSHGTIPQTQDNSNRITPCVTFIKKLQSLFIFL